MTSINRYRFDSKNLRRGVRFISGEIQVAPRYVNKLGAKHFKVVDGHLEYQGKEIVPQEDVREKITEYDASPLYSGGRDRLYHHLSQAYVGISKAAVMDFIKNSALHQLTQPNKKKVQSRPIVISKPGIYAQVDLIDMQKHSGLNNGFNWILTYVDLFSKWGAAVPLKSKHVKNVMAGMDEIFASFPKASYRVRSIQSDNGGEFAKQFEKHLKSKYNIRVIHSQAYNPSSQGAVERFNKTIKAMIFQFMTRFDSKRWVDLLPQLISNYNTTPHSATRRTPTDIMSNMGNKTMVTDVHTRLKKKAQRVTEGADSGEEFKVGQTVRVALTSEARKRKNQFEKRIAQNWSDDVYTVRSVSKPDTKFNRPTYLLRKGGRDLKKRYFNYHLLLVNPTKLVDDLKPVSERPVFDKKLFDNERHLRTGKVREVKVRTKKPEKTALQERKGRKKREKKLPARFRD